MSKYIFRAVTIPLLVTSFNFIHQVRKKVPENFVIKKSKNILEISHKDRFFYDSVTIWYDFPEFMALPVVYRSFEKINLKINEEK